MKLNIRQTVTKIDKKIISIKSSKINKQIKQEPKTYEKLHVVYRISDAGYKKEKPSFINNKNCLENALKAFSTKDADWTIICDNCSDETFEMISKLAAESNIKENKLIKCSIGHGAGTFRMAYEIALTFPENDVVYFLENDYIHKMHSEKYLQDAFSLPFKADYVALYDHPDKYNPDYKYSLLTKTKVLRGNECYWIYVVSTTMTFAAKVSTLKNDKNIFWKWTSTKHPYDFEIFLDLRKKGRKMISPIPSVGTHGETAFLAPFIDWEKIQKEGE
jgi:hypothetical protein